jgi:hypothetical protein
MTRLGRVQDSLTFDVLVTSPLSIPGPFFYILYIYPDLYYDFLYRTRRLLEVCLFYYHLKTYCGSSSETM